MNKEAWKAGRSNKKTFPPSNLPVSSSPSRFFPAPGEAPPPSDVPPEPSGGGAGARRARDGHCFRASLIHARAAHRTIAQTELVLACQHFAHERAERLHVLGLTPDG